VPALIGELLALPDLPSAQVEHEKLRAEAGGGASPDCRTPADAAA